jgi:hypothetical protein
LFDWASAVGHLDIENQNAQSAVTIHFALKPAAIGITGDKSLRAGFIRAANAGTRRGDIEGDR